MTVRISRHALLQRIERALAPVGAKLVAERIGSKSPARVFRVMEGPVVVAEISDLDKFARDLGALDENEREEDS